MEAVFHDVKKRPTAKKRYDYQNDFPSAESIGTAKRDIYAGNFTTIRGCRWWISFTHRGDAASTAILAVYLFLGGRKFRPRPISRVVEELEAIDNNRCSW